MRLSPRVLLVSGLALLTLAVLGAIVFHRPKQLPPAPTITTAPVPAGFDISALAAADVGPLSATIRWSTTFPASARLAWGPTGMRPLLWRSVPAVAGSHALKLTGLAIRTSYTVVVDARSDSGEAAHAELSFTTALAPPGVTATVTDGSLLVDGAPFFPLLNWQECPARWEPELAQGINLFGGNPCTGLPSLLATLGGRALAVGTSDDAATPGTIGWFHPDEADGRGLDAASLPQPGGPGPRFLTLTNHFWSGAAPLPQGKGVYPGLIARADVIGFDLYPLQEFCRTDLLPTVFDAQRELVALAAGKPTFQWIEVRQMKCAATPPTAITPATIRAESWLAIAGGARGLGFFPGDWGDQVGAAIAGVAARVRQLGPVLQRPVLPVQVDAPLVRASARELNGALYVIAVNAGLARTRVKLSEPSLGYRTVALAGTTRTLTAQENTISDTLPPLGVRIYVAP